MEVFNGIKVGDVLASDTDSREFLVLGTTKDRVASVMISRAPNEVEVDIDSYEWLEENGWKVKGDK